MQSKIEILNFHSILRKKEINTFEQLIKEGTTEEVVYAVYEAMESYNKQKVRQDLYTLDTVVQLANYGFNFAKTSPYAEDMPLGNVLQKLMFEKGLDRVPESFKNYQRDKEINNY